MTNKIDRIVLIAGGGLRGEEVWLTTHKALLECQVSALKNPNKADKGKNLMFQSKKPNRARTESKGS